MDLTTDIRRMMEISLVGGDPQSFLEDVKKILDLFDKLDSFEDKFSEVEPLYHPLEYRGSPRQDKVIDVYVDVSKLTDYVEDGYVYLPPIKGVKRLTR